MTDPLIFPSATPRYSLPQLFAGQAQKEATVNAAHTLKNIAATCGGDRAAKAAGSLEYFARHKEFERAAESFEALEHSIGALLQALPLPREKQ